MMAPQLEIVRRVEGLFVLPGASNRKPSSAKDLVPRPRRLALMNLFLHGIEPHKDESLEDADELPEPQDLAAEAISQLEAVVDDLREIVALVEKEEGLEK